MVCATVHSIRPVATGSANDKYRDKEKVIVMFMIFLQHVTYSQ